MVNNIADGTRFEHNLHFENADRSFLVQTSSNSFIDSVNDFYIK